MLSWVVDGFEVMESGFDEDSVSCDDAEELAMTLAVEKARTVAKKMGSGMVLGADTIVVLGEEVIGKPKDRNDARRILGKLRGREHWVYTGVALLEVETEEMRVELEKTRVSFRNFSDKELEEYVETGIPMGKAGAYAYQEGAAAFVEDLEGSLTSVIGLPVKRVVAMLEEMGVDLRVDSEAIVWRKLGRRD